MSILTAVYLLLTLPKLAILFCVIAALIGVVLFVRFIARDGYPRLVWKTDIKMAVVAFVLSVIAIFIPSKTDTYILAATYLGVEAVTSDVGNELIQAAKEQILNGIKNEGEKNGK